MSNHPGRPRAGPLSPSTIMLRRLLFTGKTHTLTLAGRSGHGVLNKLHGPVGHEGPIEEHRTKVTPAHDAKRRGRTGYGGNEAPGE